MLLNLILFFTYPFLILLSVIGYGLTFQRFFFFKKNIFLNLPILGFFGLFILYLISFSTHLILPHNFFHNVLILFFGLFLFYKFKKKIKKNELKIIIAIFFLLFIGFFIAKTNEDFPFYHLPMSLQIVEQKIQFGLGNLNIGYNHYSSLFLLNSLFYLPITGIYLFNLTNFLFQIFFFSSLLVLLNNKNIPNFVLILIGATFLIFLTKFNRLAEYGVDMPGQLLVTLSIILCFISIFNEKKIDKISSLSLFELSFYLMVFALSTKILYSIYIFIPLVLVLFLFNFKDLIKYFFNVKFLFISLFCVLSVIFYNLANSGCIIYPLSSTCFYNVFSWSLPENLIDHMSIHYSTWAKGGIGPNFAVDSPKDYVQSLKWVNHWLDVYFFNKVSDYLLLLSFFIILFLLLLKNNFKINIKIKKKNFKKFFFLVYFLIILVFLYWFLNFPTLRYAGYSIVFFIIILPFTYYMCGRLDVNNTIVKKKFLILLIICIAVFNLRNISRINDEMSLSINSSNNFSNFPFYWLKDVKYKAVKKKFISVNQVESGNSCWATPSVCVTGTGDTINVQKKNNFIIYNFK